MKRWRISSIGVALAVCVLAGCSATPASVAYATRSGVPAGLDADPLSGPAVTWLEEGETFAIVTWGSGSCPPVPTILSLEAMNRIAVTFAPSPDDPCTADMAPTTHEFELPDEITDVPVTVEIRYEDRPENVALILE
ncbi:hypothetical protein [Microbacterium paludicola]|uniref:hypothetical protein n=1 Tax=Microbacterium paludicola TaxID=300019 RepID=UPI0011A67A74|nr:hypothetical protein [Microbacterium paludicola]